MILAYRHYAVSGMTKPALSYMNGTYIIDGKEAVLSNGVSETPAAPDSAATDTVRYFGNGAQGDLNGDGYDDIAFLLTEQSGGSGTFYYIVAAVQTAAGYVGTNAILLGDRIAPQATLIHGGIINVNYADRKPDEPMTAQPSVGVSRYFRVSNGQLVEQK